MNDFIQARIPSSFLAPPPALVDPAALRGRIDRHLETVCAGFGQAAPALRAAMTGAVLTPGKRFRAVLMLLVAQATGGLRPQALDAAAAVEMVHAASLIVDDLPAMDGATLRRGAPTTHVVHGEARAILSGIALVAEAFALLARCGEARLVAPLADSVGASGLCAGQELDLFAAKSRQSLGREQDLKTGVLFVAGLQMIATLHGLSEPQTDTLARFGRLLGRVFQSWDDLRDVLEEAATLGKDKGLDARHAKGLMAVGNLGAAKAHYRTLRAELVASFDAMWFDSRPVAAYVLALLPDPDGAR